MDHFSGGGPVHWADAHGLTTLKKVTHNERNAGRKSPEDWDAIKAFLWNEIKAGREWRDWYEVWDDVVDMMKVVNPVVTNNQPYKKLENHLRNSKSPVDKGLLEQLRARIKTSRSYVQGNRDSTN